MPISNDALNVKELKDMLDSMPDDLPIKIFGYDGYHPSIYSVRKHVVTDEKDETIDAFVVING